MAVQTTYNYATPVGNPGGIFDLADYISVSRNNAEADGTLKYGVGVFAGYYDSTASAVKNAGKVVSLPGTNLTLFEGIVMNTGTAEMDKNGVVSIANKSTVGVMTRGRIWVRLYSNASVAYGDKLYLVTGGDEKGTFCVSGTTAVSGDTSFAKTAINGKFITAGSGDVAAVDFFGGCVIAENDVGAVTLAGLTDVDVSAKANGKVLKYNSTSTKWEAADDATE